MLKALPANVRQCQTQYLRAKVTIVKRLIAQTPVRLTGTNPISKIVKAACSKYVGLFIFNTYPVQWGQGDTSMS